jgi:hypothetical protein
MHEFIKFIVGIELSDSFFVHYQESSTVHTAIGLCHTVWNILIPLASSQHNLYDI